MGYVEAVALSAGSPVPLARELYGRPIRLVLYEVPDPEVRREMIERAAAPPERPGGPAVFPVFSRRCAGTPKQWNGPEVARSLTWGYHGRTEFSRTCPGRAAAPGVNVPLQFLADRGIPGTTNSIRALFGQPIGYVQGLWCLRWLGGRTMRIISHKPPMSPTAPGLMSGRQLGAAQSGTRCTPRAPGGWRPPLMPNADTATLPATPDSTVLGSGSGRSRTGMLASPTSATMECYGERCGNPRSTGPVGARTRGRFSGSSPPTACG